MRTTVTLATALLVVFLSGCNWNNYHRYKAQVTLTKTVDHIAGSALEIKTHNGRIEVVASPLNTEVIIVARLRARGQTQEEADKRLAATTVTVERTADHTLVIRPIFPEPRRSGDAASFTVTLPDAHGVILDTSNGSVVAHGLSGHLVIDTSNGRVEVLDHNGSATIDTSNGSIVVNHHIGSLTVDTSNGAIRLRDVDGEVRADTSNGPITVALVADQPGPINVDTSNGSVTIEVGRGFTGTVRLDTSNGSISINDSLGRISSQTVKRNHGQIVVGQGGESSRVDTSNGGISFTIRGS